MDKLIGSKTYEDIINLKSYTTKSGDNLKLGDTLVVGKPSNSNNLQSNQYINGKTNNHTHIFLGTTASMAFGGAFFANENMTGDKMIITEIKMGRNGKKHPYYIVCSFNKVGGGSFLNIKKLARADIEKALDSKEIINPKAKMTKEDALKKLKEAKDLLDVEMITKEEFENLKLKLKPIINQ
jgi:hypothetical protein